MSIALSDQAARERITGDLGSNLGVEAGAGTGKTTVLVERVTNVLATGRATVDELVVITFTEKAAAELSTRVREALEKRAATSDGAERERVLAAARDLYRCHIETIHSFASARCCASGRSRPGSTRCSRSSTGWPGASRSTPPTRPSRTSCCPREPPSSTGRCGAGSGSTSSARRAR